MKILIFYQYFGTPKGCWSTRVYEFCRRWIEAGNQITVVTSPYEKSDVIVEKFITRLDIKGIKLIVINSGDSNKFTILKRIVKASIYSFYSCWYALTLKYDICIASSGPITVGLPMIFAKKIRSKKTIFEVRDLWPAGGIEMGLIKQKWQQNMALWFEKMCYKSSDLVVTASIGQKSHILKRFPKLKIRIIPNASDLELFGELCVGNLPGWVKGRAIFSHIGSLGLIHNTQYWLEVAKALNVIDINREVCLVFIGDGKDRELLIKEKEKSNLQNIYFLGLMPKSELPFWVQNSTATLFATLNNEVQNACSPNKVFDSFAAGIPIVQTSTGWIGEMVERENCGLNVPLLFPEKAAQSILFLANNPTAAKEMGKNALRLAQTVFNRDRLASEYLNLMEEIS